MVVPLHTSTAGPHADPQSGIEWVSMISIYPVMSTFYHSILYISVCVPCRDHLRISVFRQRAVGILFAVLAGLSVGYFAVSDRGRVVGPIYFEPCVCKEGGCLQVNFGYVVNAKVDMHGRGGIIRVFGATKAMNLLEKEVFAYYHFEI